MFKALFKDLFKDLLKALLKANSLSQALLLAAQFHDEWPLLIVAPSSLRFVWRDQAAQWLPQLVGPEGEAVHVVRPK